MQAAEIDLDLQTRPIERPNTSSVWICRISVDRFPNYPPFLFLVTLTIDLDLQSHPSKGPNTSSLWIWRKSVQHLPRYFIHKQKSDRQRQKQNLTQLIACDSNNPNNPLLTLLWLFSPQYRCSTSCSSRSSFGPRTTVWKPPYKALILRPQLVFSRTARPPIPWNRCGRWSASWRVRWPQTWSGRWVRRPVEERV